MAAEDCSAISGGMAEEEDGIALGLTGRYWPRVRPNISVQQSIKPIVQRINHFKKNRWDDSRYKEVWDALKEDILETSMCITIAAMGDSTCENDDFSIPEKEWLQCTQFNNDVLCGRRDCDAFSTLQRKFNEIDVQVSGFTFVGCYADEDEDRDLPMLMKPQWHYYDKDSCYQACSKAGYGKIVRIPMPPCAYPILI